MRDFISHIRKAFEEADSELIADTSEGAVDNIAAPPPGVPTDTTRPVPGVPEYRGLVLYVVYDSKQTPKLDDLVKEIVDELNVQLVSVTRNVRSPWDELALKLDGFDPKKIKTLPSMAVNARGATPLRGVSNKVAITAWLKQQLGLK